MKDFYNSFSNRAKAIYYVWVFLNFVLLLLSGNLSRSDSFDSSFFPFDYGRLKFNIEVYDYSEFILYSISLIFIIIIIRLWKKDRLTRIPKTVSDEPLQNDNSLSSSALESLNPDIGKLILCTQLTIEKIIKLFKITKEREVELYLFAQWVTNFSALFKPLYNNLKNESFESSDVIWISNRNIPIDYRPVLSQKRKTRFTQYDKYFSPILNLISGKYDPETSEFTRVVLLNLFGENEENKIKNNEYNFLKVIIDACNTNLLLFENHAIVSELISNHTAEVMEEVEINRKNTEKHLHPVATKDNFVEKPTIKVNSELFLGGDGATEQNAVIINATSSIIGIPAEYEFIEAMYGSKGTGWELEEQMQYDNNSKNFDIIEIKLSDGTHKKYYFDITNFFGKF
jgi:hypothetical protein